MRWLRSYPSVIPDKRSYVEDATLERLVISDYDYTPLGAIHDDVVLLEWDIALGLGELAEFSNHTERDPHRVIVAPYKLYHVPGAPRWAHRRLTDRLGVPGERWIFTGEHICDYFSFGLIYLPHELVQEFLAAPAPQRGAPPGTSPATYNDCRFTDQTFSVWHHRSGYGPVAVDWLVQPVHLHY